MLNPSTANEAINDPTVERCERRARAMGFGRMDIINLFALRSTDPAGLYECPDPVGPENDAAILAACRQSRAVVCAWGEHGKHENRSSVVRQLLADAGVTTLALQVNQSGEPKHPLYVAYSVEPTPYVI